MGSPEEAEPGKGYAPAIGQQQELGSGGELDGGQAVSGPDWPSS